MIQPTVGRVVLFFPKDRAPEDGPLAALIARVHSDTHVNLAVFLDDGSPWLHPPTSITLVQPGEAPPEKSHYCTWMPYQIGQAAKVEELQKQLDAKSE